jgi:hypothetical protein
VAQLKPVASAIAELKDLEAQQEYMDKDARTERKVIHDRMAEVKRALEAAPAASGQTTTSSAQTAAGPAPSSPGSNRGLIIGSYDIACDGECFDNIKVPRSPMIMEELTDFLQDIDRMVTREEVYGDWSVLVTPHKFDEKKSDDGETDKDSSKDGNK